MVKEVITIEGKIVNNKYQFKIIPNLDEIDFVQAMEKNRKVFKSKFLGEEIVAISVWTTPKRTKTYPFARVYDTLSFDGTKITIIPVMVDYGKFGERGIIQPNTVYWMTGIGVYLILGVYIDADKGEVGKLAKNAGIDTKSREGSPKFAQGQRFDIGYLQSQIEKIIREKPYVKTWNENQLSMIPSFLDNAVKQYKRLGEKLQVPLADFSKFEKRISTWRKDSKTFLAYCEKNSKGAQHREVNSNHVLESVPGAKGKINIDFGDLKKLYLTSDALEIDEKLCLVTLLEGKNTTSGKFPGWGDIKDGLLKLMIFKNSEFYYNGKKFEKRLVCYLTGQENNAEEEFRKECKSLIEECNSNKIELRLNNKIIS